MFMLILIMVVVIVVYLMASGKFEEKLNAKNIFLGILAIIFLILMVSGVRGIGILPIGIFIMMCFRSMDKKNK